MAPASYTLIWPFYFRLAVWFLSLAIEHRASSTGCEDLGTGRGGDAPTAVISAFRGGGPLESSHDWWSTASRSCRAPDSLGSLGCDDDAVLSPHWHCRLCNYRRPLSDHKAIPISQYQSQSQCIRYDRDRTHSFWAQPSSAQLNFGFSFASDAACNYFLLNLHHMWNMSKS